MSAIAATSSTASTRRVRRFSCTGIYLPRGYTPSRAQLAYGSATVVGHQHLTQRLEVLHALAGAEDHGVERTVGDVHRHPRLLADPLVEAPQQGTAAGKGDAAVHHGARQLGRALVEGRL